MSGLRRIALPLVAPLLIAVLPSCSTTSADPEGDDLLARAPTDGTIVLYKPALTKGGRRYAPNVIKVTTQPTENVARDEPLRLEVGAIPEETPDERPTEKRIVRDRLSQGSVYLVSPERFAELWAELEGIGVFDLPRFRGGIPPENKAYLSLTGGGRTWVFLRPTDAPPRDLPKEREKLDRMKGAWEKTPFFLINSTRGS